VDWTDRYHKVIEWTGL